MKTRRYPLFFHHHVLLDSRKQYTRSIVLEIKEMDASSTKIAREVRHVRLEFSKSYGSIKKMTKKLPLVSSDITVITYCDKKIYTNY